jgi:outer membrane protein OmpA-like peptidoglycan-associated protein
MKQLFKYGFLALVMQGCVAYSQEIQNPYTLYIGINAIDSRTSAGGADGWVANHFKDFFAADRDWNFFPYSLNVRLSRYVNNSVVVGASVSMNLIDKYAVAAPGGGVTVANPGNLLYYGFDVSLSYSFKRLLAWKHFDPALILGGGYTVLGDNGYPTLNPGGSITYWINPSWGFELATKYKKSFDTRDQAGMPYAPSLFQHTAGFVFKFGKKDKDADGVADQIDACPEVKGLALFKGCPDSDKDGVPDPEDTCPDVAGLFYFKGCPDTDLDGVSDNVDACPTIKGLSYLKGCPDGDNDGVADQEDECPTVKGLFVLKGCPDTRAEAIVQEQLEFENTAKNVINTNRIHFETGSARLTSINTVAYIDLLASYMKQLPQARFLIEGHTDTVGSEAFNLQLSIDRAVAIRDALVARGVNPAQLTTLGLGYGQPVAPNDTAEGRAQNRRTVIRVQQ